MPGPRVGFCALRVVPSLGGVSMIGVKQTDSGDPFEFKVTVQDGGGETRHRVTMERTTYQKLTGGKVSAESCVRAAFAFLLDREPKESILSRFDITVIEEYFPSFEKELGTYMKSE